MFSKVLIANRGAIASRIIRSLKKMGIQSVAVYSEADAHSLHVSQADQAFSLGHGAASDTYLNTAKIFEIIQSAGVDAVHPGYGFLSENPEFVAHCAKRGVTFIGPTPEHMNAFGLKHKARHLAETNNVPLLPGSQLLASVDQAVATATTIGFPIILKSTAGGGGIGMQVCRNEIELSQSFDSVKRLSANNFSNDGVFVEKYIEFARHIEVQVFGDGKGNAVAFGERDCSTQRRHQKVIEETPAPNIPDAIRNQLHATATQLLAAVNYVNAGTVEYIYDQSNDQFYFLEVNTRLQVEHGVTEEIFGVDLVEWMVKQAAGELGNIQTLRAQLTPKGHAIQARIYAENPHKDFQPCAGLLSQVAFPATSNKLRIDHWIETGIDVSPFFDPMLAKVICTASSREQTIADLTQALSHITLQGIETNLTYVSALLNTDVFEKGEIYTRYLDSFTFSPATIDVLSAGTMTTIQDYPGRTGYWDVGVPPSGPFDAYAFQLGNRALGNAGEAAGLEITLHGPTLVFNKACDFILTGAEFSTSLDNQAIEFYTRYQAKAGQTLKITKPLSAGARCYLLIAGGIDGNHYLGSRSTFTLGNFGGFSGRSLRTGDVLHLAEAKTIAAITANIQAFRPQLSGTISLHVIYGPHGAPDFFTPADMEMFFSTDWEIHYNSSRTGIRLIGPKPQWARKSGGEAGMHPSNIHDNAYAVGTVDFTGDMPVILGPDGPSLGGFVCPATVIQADLWKLGQLKAGDKVRFIPVSLESAGELESAQKNIIKTLDVNASLPLIKPVDIQQSSPVLHRISEEENGVEVCYRAAGDKYLLVEYGPQQLDIALRFRVHALMLNLQKLAQPEILELTPGIRSLQIRYDSLRMSALTLISLLVREESKFENLEQQTVPSRIVHIPLSWDDDACKQAVVKYMQSVRKDAPWCPDNIEFIRRINGLDSIKDVKKIVFDATYVVMGLGDVYLGAPVATPLDPRHRLVTTKYNPARTWTAENSVGIGGAYLCVYGMEGPGGYQFIGRTLQMWNKIRQTTEFEKPWLLRFFDQIRFYEVSAAELLEIREKFPRGQYPLNIEQTEFNLKEYQESLQQHDKEISSFVTKRESAYEQELAHWNASGLMTFEHKMADKANDDNNVIEENCSAIESHVAGSIWQWQVAEGDKVSEGQTLCILESMKMEIDVVAPSAGIVKTIMRQQGDQITAGQIMGVIQHA
ncbi:urea carboxylase [Teredinibacter haidensis]|uniref:urea carboxylase n=1 Tax=Teredinibacter haidensis TaxID=2731755 RepID=UPI000948D96E|nr:urea carboxylase [Teredinibacter haidensis]